MYACMQETAATNRTNQRPSAQQRVHDVLFVQQQSVTAQVCPFNLSLPPSFAPGVCRCWCGQSLLLLLHRQTASMMASLPPGSSSA